MLDLEYDIPNKDVRKWAAICHASALLGCIPFTFGQILGPLVVWLMKRDEHPYIEDQGRESLNFQLSMTIYVMVTGTVVWLLKFIWIGNLLMWVPFVIYLSQVLLSIVGAIRAWDGEKFRYPFSIPFISR